MKIDPNKIRLHILELVYRKKSGHIGGAMSISDLVACLYSNMDLKNDMMILSKGHAVPAIYGALIELGIYEAEWAYEHFREFDSPLQGHCDKRLNEHIKA